MNNDTILLLKDVYKRYKVGKDKYFTALSTTNISFNKVGLVSICGKSGSGKSTLLNMMTGIDSPSGGEIVLNNKKYSKLKGNNKSKFFNKEIGIVFQSYNLIESRSALDNVILPLLIGGKRKGEAYKIAANTLTEVDISPTLFDKKSSLLSGGEKQRVALARAIVNKPKVLFCDEPTGALDSINSIKVMELLKRISKSILVIVVSHNLQLVTKYSDREMEISDGKIIKDLVITKSNSINTIDKEKYKSSSSWTSKFASFNYKKRLSRNLISTLALSISLTMFFIVFGFITHKDISLKEACFKQFDFGSGTVSEEIKTGGNGILSLTKSNRPNLQSLLGNSKISENYEICLNFGAILPQNIGISYQDKQINDILFTPIYSFDETYVSASLLSMGQLPKSDNLEEIVVNDKAYDLLFYKLGKSPLNEVINFDQETPVTYVNESDEYINDTFTFHKQMKVIGVVKELNYLNTPKIYYSYIAINEYMKESVLVNLSTYFGYELTWYDRVSDAENYSLISSFSYQLFLKDINKKEVAFNKDIFTGNLSFYSPSIALSESLFNFMQVAEYGLILFMVIALIGTVIILTIMTFTSYSEDHKESAILLSIGASESNIEDIYVQEGMVNGLIAYISSMIISYGLSKLINFIISKFIDLNNLIEIPFISFLGIKVLFPLAVLAVIIFIVLFSTLIPISFGRRHSIKEEMQSL